MSAGEASPPHETPVAGEGAVPPPREPASAARGSDEGRPVPAPKPTIRNVAERAGVSKSLVSLVMRGSPHVSERRRQAVLQAARELGYRPNAVARSLVEGRTRLIWAIVADLHNPFFAEFLDGLQESLHGAGLRMLVGSGRGRRDHQHRTAGAQPDEPGEDEGLRRSGHREGGGGRADDPRHGGLVAEQGGKRAQAHRLRVPGPTAFTRRWSGSSLPRHPRAR